MSVRPSVRLSVCPVAFRSISAAGEREHQGAQAQPRRQSCGCGQRHAVSRGTRFNGDVLRTAQYCDDKAERKMQLWKATAAAKPAELCTTEYCYSPKQITRTITEKMLTDFNSTQTVITAETRKTEKSICPLVELLQWMKKTLMFGFIPETCYY